MSIHSTLVTENVEKYIQKSHQIQNYVKRKKNQMERTSAHKK